VVWFRKEFNVPATMAGKSGLLNLGCIIDADSVWINGVFVGNTTYMYPPRWYNIPEKVLQVGVNTIAIRIVNERGKGGFVAEKPYEISVGDAKIDLKGTWKYKLGATMDHLDYQTFIRWKPLGLYNAMLAPLLQYSMKGVIWYQGESNTGRAKEYQELFPAMIRNWRQDWKQGDFPFLFVQLANFMEASQQPKESNWALLREAQLKSLSLPNTGMAVSIDIGEWNDIHPLNKAEVGRRLALAAKHVAYKDHKIIYSGPVYKSMQKAGNSILLNFDHIGSGLDAKNGLLQTFAIAGEDQKFVWAEAQIKGNQVIVSSKEIPNPVAVRYAWADNPQGANLYNKDGLPATPFRTDNW
jgi:sialate O-acetylesterase